MLKWHESNVSRDERAAVLQQKPLTLWLTGLSAAGKSTLAFELERVLLQHKHSAYVLDGDNVRHGLNKNLGFSKQDRAENLRRIAETAQLMNDAGLIVITAFIAPSQADRALAKNIIGADCFYEVYISTSLEICESRDPKGLYRKARLGEIADFTGVSSPYEPPHAPALSIDTNSLSMDKAVALLLALVKQHQQ